MRLQKWLLPLLVLGALLIAALFYFKKATPTDEHISIVHTVQEADFHINVSATGELQAKNSEKIIGPQSMRSAGIWQTSITDLVDEGSVVKQGDYVATLDRTEIDNKLKDGLAEMEKLTTQLEQAKIDTAIELRGVRDNLINLKFSMQEKQLQVEQNKYEPQMVIQQAELDLQRTQRDYNQLQSKYELKKEQAIAKISEIDAQIKQQENKLNLLRKLNEEFIIKAPKDGMVIYARSWNGEKKGPGTQVSSWNPTVAELPDLSDMISKAYVNEVDISRVKQGQDVVIKVDAFPDKTYSGQVFKVANIGEQLRDFDSKVFEVSIQLHEQDTILRPAMTTGIDIHTDTYEQVLSVPLEALYADSLSFVYKKMPTQIVKQEVITGASNNNAIIVEHGLQAGDRVLLHIPENADDLDFVPIDTAIKTNIQQQRADEKARQQAQALENKKAREKKETSQKATSTGKPAIPK